jgi:PAS domain S-box-containing protein
LKDHNTQVKKVLFISFTYVAFSIAWILITDSLEREFSTYFTTSNYQTIKGLLFVSLSGLLIFFLTFISHKNLSGLLNKLSIIEALKNNALEQNFSFTWIYSINSDEVYFQGYFKNQFFNNKKNGKIKLISFYELLSDFAEFEEVLNELITGKINSCSKEISIRYDQTSFQYNCSLDRIVQKGSVYIICYCNNITEIKHLFAEVSKSKKMLSSVMQSIPDILLLIENTSHKINFFYYHDEDDILVKKEDLLGQDLTLFLPEHIADELKRRLGKDDEYKESYRYELEVNNKRQWYEARFVAHDANNTLLIVRNITKEFIAQRERDLYFEQLKNAEEVLNFAFWSYNSGEGERFVSQKIVEVFECEFTDEHDVKRILQFVHKDDLAFVNENYRRFLNKEPLLDGIFRLEVSGGRYKYILQRVKSQKIAENISYTGVFVDVTNEVTIKADLKEKTRLLNVLSLYTNDIIFVYDPGKGFIEYISESAKKYIAEEDISEVRKSFFKGYFEERHYKTLSTIVTKKNGSLFKALKDNFKSELLFFKYKQRPVWVECSLYLHKDEENVYILGVIKDINDAKLNLEKLQMANMRFSIASKASTDAIWDWDLVDNTFEWTENVELFFGHPVSEIPPEPEGWFSLCHPEDREKVSNSIRSAIDDKKNYWESEYKIIDGSGNYRYVLNRAILLTENGQVVRIIGAIHDITAEKETMNKLSEQNKKLREIAWTQSHLVRAPLARILGLIEMYDEVEKNIDSKSINQLIYASAKELDEIIHLINDKTQDVS